MNAYSNNEENNYEFSPDSPTENKNVNFDDEKNYYEFTPDTPTNGGNNETIDNDGDKNYEEESEK